MASAGQETQPVVHPPQSPFRNFPGPVGTLYRAFVIGSGGHVLVTRRLLKTVKREAGKRGSSSLSPQPDEPLRP